MVSSKPFIVSIAFGFIVISIYMTTDYPNTSIIPFKNYIHHNSDETPPNVTKPVYRTSPKYRPKSRDRVMNRSIEQLQSQNLRETSQSLRNGMDKIKVLRKDVDGNVIAAEENYANTFRRQLLKSMKLDDNTVEDYFFDRHIETQPDLDDWDDIPQQLKKYAPVIFKTVPNKMAPNFKSPCWYRRGSLNCLPYFYILGMTKCGTSDLWNKTVVHPQVIGTPKETHWWTHRFGKHQSISFLFKYTERALGGIDMPSPEIGKLKSMKVLGDGSPSTLWNNKFWRKIYPLSKEPPYVNADVINAITPNAKLLIILRDPVDRLYSSYNFFQRTHRSSPEEFHEVAIDAVGLFEECLKFAGLRACTYQPAPYGKSPVYNTEFTGGLYHVYLEEWFRLFPKEQILLIELNDWHINCVENLSKVYKLLELDPDSGYIVHQSCNQSIRVSPKKHVAQPMLEKTRRFLQEKYQPYNERLYELLKDDRFDWRYTK